MKIEQVKNTIERKAITKHVLTKLPDWFGIPSSTNEYVENSGSLSMWAAYHGEEVVGFLSLLQHNEYSVEIYVMGIIPNYHRRGIGKRLFHCAYEWCQSNKIEYIQVKTLDESSNDPSYAETREFYYSMGFRPLECFKTLWDEWNPCLVMVQKIER
ncbi:GNAT family N-acetyltransferase [Lachnoclostridium phytofermentans]|uniref:GNAT family N-acetyltransferase n=1 Tax=Lachnoclostridium phytofermentans TaxID=66219 RepID=UPI0004953642|nr:GNAT family N-acetyltransferase [Lachnoclostridium phytofermentans]